MKENYAEYVKNHSHGVKSECEFNSLPFFHNVQNWTCDLMHDFLLGVCRYDMAKIIRHFIKQKYFSVSDLNNRIKQFDHSEYYKGNKIPEITVKSGYLIISAAQMSALVTYFGIIMGDLIPHDDPVLELYSSLYDILLIVTAPSITEIEIKYLTEVIKSHNELFLNSF